jgi:hypothetical protein
LGVFINSIVLQDMFQEYFPLTNSPFNLFASLVTMPRKEKSHDTPEQGEESLAARLDDFQATNESKFGAINATLQ